QSSCLVSPSRKLPLFPYTTLFRSIAPSPGEFSEPFHLRKTGWAPLTAHDAHRLALHDVCAWVLAAPGPVPQRAAHDLGEVEEVHGLVLEQVDLEADDRALVGDPDQQVAAFRIEERH